MVVEKVVVKEGNSAQQRKRWTSERQWEWGQI
jgi:hypothetical protein